VRELEDEIHLLNLRAEQLVIHLQELWSGSPEAIATRRKLEAMVKTLVSLQDERARLLREGDSAQRLVRESASARVPGSKPGTEQ
jgi:hypothetical protein